MFLYLFRFCAFWKKVFLCIGIDILLNFLLIIVLLRSFLTKSIKHIILNNILVNFTSFLLFFRHLGFKLIPKLIFFNSLVTIVYLLLFLRFLDIKRIPNIILFDFLIIFVYFCLIILNFLFKCEDIMVLILLAKPLGEFLAIFKRVSNIHFLFRKIR